MAKRKTRARNHHWVSQCYLKGFATPASKSGRLFAYDFKEDRSFEPTPRNVGAKRDFNRIDIPGLPIDAIESAMSDFEREVGSAIGKIALTKQFSDEEQRNFIFNFIALLAVRNPRFRETRRAFMEQTSKLIIDLVLSSKERYESEVEKAIAAGEISPESDVSYEDMKGFQKRKQYTYEVPREYQISEEFQFHDDVLQVLGRRRWLLIHSTPEIGSFITCDHPVFLRPISAKLGVSYRLGFGSSNSSVLFPLTKYTFLIGEYGIEDGVISATSEMVAGLNTEIVAEAERQIYAADNQFTYFDEQHGEIKHGWQLSADSKLRT